MKATLILPCAQDAIAGQVVPTIEARAVQGEDMSDLGQRAKTPRVLVMGFVRHGMQQPADVAGLIVDAIFDDAPPARLDVAGSSEHGATSLDEGRLQAGWR